MKAEAIKTHIVTTEDTNILKIIDQYVPSLAEGSVLAVTSKIVAVAQGRVVKDVADKDTLIKKEADWWLPRSLSKYDFLLTIKENKLLPSAGIDESNSKEGMVLWPQDSQKVANEIREHLVVKHNLEKIAVIITDSKTSPLSWGTTGTMVAHSGFAALHDYIGSEDLFERTMEVTKANIAEALAAAAVLVMGEGNEQTPLAVIEDIPAAEFQQRNPTQEELDSLKIDIEDDLYEPLLTKVKWQKGGK
ncbi:MAG: coenzyme F420-0:L-glutamate ligase [archaeon]|jgi:putative folate metabolism gamma-glutamate ligase|nr:coenzyme F420-0:L-glutamate ligase [archaeon]